MVVTVTTAKVTAQVLPPLLNAGQSKPHSGLPPRDGFPCFRAEKVDWICQRDPEIVSTCSGCCQPPESRERKDEGADPKTSRGSVGHVWITEDGLATKQGLPQRRSAGTWVRTGCCCGGDTNQTRKATGSPCLPLLDSQGPSCRERELCHREDDRAVWVSFPPL